MSFEPVKSFAAAIKKRFKNKNKIKVYDFGLSNRNGNIYLFLQGDKTREFKESKKAFVGKVMNIKKFINNNDIKEIDLMKINIEGGEYDLLDYLIAEKLVKKIKNIQVQLHKFVANAEERTKVLHRKLLRTHKPTYQYEFIWENWRRT